MPCWHAFAEAAEAEESIPQVTPKNIHIHPHRTVVRKLPLRKECGPVAQRFPVLHLRLSKMDYLRRWAKYTMVLGEHGDRIDTQPSYRTIMVSQYPPRFKSVVSFEGTEENGESRTKKDAKHIASRKMCERLAIHLA